MAFDESLAARIRDALARNKGVKQTKMFGVRAFDITHRPMRNWMAVEPDGVEDDN